MAVFDLGYPEEEAKVWMIQVGFGSHSSLQSVNFRLKISILDFRFGVCGDGVVLRRGAKGDRRSHTIVSVVAQA